MPRLVTRQWHVLYPASATVGTFGRSQWPSMRALAARPSSYSRKKTPDKKVFRQIVPPQNSAIIIPTSVPNTQPADVVQYIKPVPPALLNVDPFCVILLTPSFASWLLKDDTFVQNVLLKAYAKLGITTESRKPRINALCSVVNKLPSGRAFASGSELEQEVLKRAREPLVEETGFEGIAYATFPVTASIPSSTPLQETGGALDFILDDPGNKQVIQVPLANTIFQTGTLTTMSFSVWELSHEAERLELLSKSRVSHHGIRIAARGPAVDDIVSTFSVPALPLTMPRRIEGCLGNIIRQISVGPENNVVTASSELEETVPMFFKSRGESTQATTVWALIVPAAISEKVMFRTARAITKSRGWKYMEAGSQKLLWERFWQENPPKTNTLISAALADGARLHRVLSGGGGWGKKAGLLSLDPSPSNRSTMQSETGDSVSSLYDPGDLASALTPVAQVGDFIQFFISPARKTNVEENQSVGLEKLMALPKDNTWGWELGTIPSTIDSDPRGSWQQTTADSQEIAVFRNTFGVLAEGGLTITKQLVKKDTMPVSTSTSTFVVDVPFSRFWAVEVKEIGAPKKISMHESEKSKNFGTDSTLRYLSVLPIADSGEVSLTKSFHPLPNPVSRTTTTRYEQTVSQLGSELRGDGDTIATTPPGSIKEPQIRRVRTESPTHDHDLARKDLVSRKKLQIRKIRSEGPILDDDFTKGHTRSRQEPQIRRLLSEDSSLDRYLTGRDSEWRLASKKARRIEGIIKRLRLQVREVLSICGLDLDSQGRPMEVLKAGTKARSLSSEKITDTIRKIASDPPFNSNVARDRLHQVVLVLNKLTQEHRAIMRTLYQDKRKARNLITSDQHLLSRYRQPQYAVPNPLDDVNSAFGNDNHFIGTLERDIEPICSAPLLQNVSFLIANEFSSIKVNMSAAQMELAKLLQWVSLRAHIIYAANDSALRLYALHIALRWQLGHMIRSRLHHKPILRSEIYHLESRIFVLRDYHGNLFCNRPGITEEQVKRYLIARELRSPVQRRLGQRMHEKNRALRKQVEASTPATLRSKVHKMFDTPLVRTQVTRRPLIRRRATRHLRRQNFVVRKHMSSIITSKVHRYRRENIQGADHLPLRFRRLSRVSNRNALQNRTPRKINGKWSNTRAMEIAKTKRREEFISRVNSWLRGAMLGTEENGSGTERQGADGKRLFGIKTSPSEDLGSEQKDSALGQLLGTAMGEDEGPERGPGQK